MEHRRFMLTASGSAAALSSGSALDGDRPRLARRRRTASGYAASGSFDPGRPIPANNARGTIPAPVSGFILECQGFYEAPLERSACKSHRFFVRFPVLPWFFSAAAPCFPPCPAATVRLHRMWWPPSTARRFCGPIWSGITRSAWATTRKRCRLKRPKSGG